MASNNEYDGSITLAVTTKTDVKDVKQSVDSLERSTFGVLSKLSDRLFKMPDAFDGVTQKAKELTSAVSGIDVNNLSGDSKVAKMQIDLAKAQSTAQELRQEIQRLENEKVINPEYEQTLKRSVDLTRQIEQLTIKIQNEGSKSKSYGRDVSKLQQLKQELQSVTQYERQMVAEGSKYIIPDNSAKIDKLRLKLASTETQASKLSSQLAKAGSTNGFSKATSSVSKLGSTASKVTNIFKKLKKTGKDAGDKISGSFKGGLKNVLKYALGIRSFYILWNKTRQALVEGLGTMGKQVPEVRNNLNSLKAAFGNLKNSIATAFQPILTAVTPILVNFINLLTQVINKVAQFTAAITGQRYTYQANAQAASDYADATNSAARAQDKLYKSGLDTFNNYTQDSQSGSGGGANTGTPEPTYSQTQVSADIQEFVKRIKQAWRDADFTEIGTIVGNKLNDALNNIPWNKIQNTANKIGRSIATFLNGFFETPGLFDNLGRTVGESINTALELAKGFVENFHFDSFGTSIANFINGAVRTIRWRDLGKLVSDGLKGAMEAVSSFLTNTDFQGIGRAIVDFISNIDFIGLFAHVPGLFGSLTTAIYSLLVGVVTGLLNNVADLFDELGLNSIAGFLRGISTSLSTAMTTVVNWFKTYILEPIKNFFGIHSPSTVFAEIGGYLIQGLVNGIRGAVNTVTSAISTVYHAVTDKFSDIKTWFTTKFTGAVTAIKTVFNSGNLKAFFNGVWTNIKGCFGSVATWFQTTFSTAWTKVKDVFSKGGKVFTGITQGILNGLKTVINKLIDGINTVIATPFNGLNTALTKIKNVSIMGAKPFKNLISTISIPKIPKLAKGGVIPPNKEFLAILGDQKQGTNIEAPLETIKEGLRQVMLEGYGNNNQGGTYEFVAQLNRHTLFDEFITEAKMRKLQSGQNPILSI